MGLGLSELIIILILVLFFYGGKKLPLIGEGLGRGVTEFKRAIRNLSAPDREDQKQSGGSAEK